MVEIQHMMFISPVVVTKKNPRTLILILKREGANTYAFQFKSRNLHNAESEWRDHSSGMFSVMGETGKNNGKGINSTGWEYGQMKTIKVDTFYRKLEKMGYRFNDSFKCITDIKAENGYSVSTIRKMPTTGYSVVMDPGIIDSCIQALLPMLPEAVVREKPHSIYVPVFLSGFSLYRPFTDVMYCYGKKVLWDNKKETFLGSLMIRETNGKLNAIIDKFRLKRVDSTRLIGNTDTGVLK